MEDNAFNKLVEHIQSQLTKFHDINDLLDQENQDVSNSSIGQDINDMQDQIQTLIKQIQNSLQILDNNTGHLAGRQQKNKQIKQFYKKEIDKFSQASRLLEQQLQQKRKTMATNLQQKQNDPKPKPIDDLQEQLMQNQYDIENQIIREKNEELQRIELKVQIVNNILQDLAFQVDLANKPLDLVAENQVTAINNIGAAKRELVKAEDSQKSANKKWIIIATLIAILVGVLIIILILNWN
ncbi:unnamed protein product [Paramecium octaurelia]|uniref:t-SNARE coiled-coil homology domain-containing protein n=1 Tax=Paramecium octaurelia TaxID=43137 RepID=A0A8S1UHK9_PAROT|nr:unnamed protein product [Paramecium octaurelia]